MAGKTAALSCTAALLLAAVARARALAEAQLHAVEALPAAPLRAAFSRAL